MATWLIFGGKRGWIGQIVMQLLREQGDNPVAAESRLEYREAIERELDKVKPDYVINAAGKVSETIILTILIFENVL
jgi:dTDP-4-dehydrorhamnose reductase